MSNYAVTIGLEVHAEINTRTKAFCSCACTSGAIPNTHVCPMCLGLPGAIPSVNRLAIEKVITTAIAFEADVAHEIVFERKNYFYPDLPKGYQLVQYNHPIGVGGKVVLLSGKEVEIDRIQLEEDTGKSIHNEEIGMTYVDFNRSGIPIAEIVCKPTILSAEEIVELVSIIKDVLMFSDVSDCRQELGRLRFDVNISLSNTDNLGARVELINLTSSDDVRRAIAYEVDRQSALLDMGEKVVQETRMWSGEMDKTYTVRSKENVKDYRHVADPDLPIIKITERDIKKLRKALPESKASRVARYKDFGLEESAIGLLVSSKEISNYYDNMLAILFEPVEVYNWIATELLRHSREQGCSKLDKLIKPLELANIISMCLLGKISRYNAKIILDEVVLTGKSVAMLVREHNMLGGISEHDHHVIMDEIIETNPTLADDYKTSPDRVINYIVGEALEMSQGRADIDTIKRITEERLK